MAACDDEVDEKSIAEEQNLSKAEKEVSLGSMDKVPEEKSLDESKAKKVCFLHAFRAISYSTKCTSLHIGQHALIQIACFEIIQAMASFSSSQQADKEAAKQREKELAAIRVAKEDVELVAHVSQGPLISACHIIPIRQTVFYPGHQPMVLVAAIEPRPLSDYRSEV